MFFGIKINYSVDCVVFVRKELGSPVSASMTMGLQRFFIFMKYSMFWCQLFQNSSLTFGKEICEVVSTTFKDTFLTCV